MNIVLLIRDSITRARAIEVLRGLGEGEWSVTIKPHKSTRSLSQNSLMWVWYSEISEHIADSTGQHYSPDEIHDYFASRFLPGKVVDIGGRIVKTRRSTTTLNVGEFSEYLNRIERYAQEALSLQLSHPDDSYYQALMIGEK